MKSGAALRVQPRLIQYKALLPPAACRSWTCHSVDWRFTRFCLARQFSLDRSRDLRRIDFVLRRRASEVRLFMAGTIHFPISIVEFRSSNSDFPISIFEFRFPTRRYLSPCRRSRNFGPPACSRLSASLQAARPAFAVRA